MTHICVSDLTSIGSDNGLSPGRRQAIIRTNAGILLIRPLGTHFSEFLVEILIFSFKKMRLKVSSAKRRPFCLGLNELMDHVVIKRFPCPAQDNLMVPFWRPLGGSSPHNHRPSHSRGLSSSIKPIDQALTLINPFHKIYHYIILILQSMILVFE